ncbi:MAG: hypothetical protein LQ340_002978 [Diploschistes diacapsis]|nr:MAG: hypothetical protein LQ340_002978 [Diploschistes diacapsis]
MSKPLHLDGTTLEGGGQLLRLALGLSAITGKDVHLTDIRGKRGASSRNGQAGGIKPAHYAGAAWLANATNAKTEGLEVKSKELVFCPSIDPEAAQKGAGSDLGQEQSKQAPRVWKDIYESHMLVRRESEIEMKTPGSIFLILQAILPYLLFSSGNPECLDPVMLRITITGGTNVWHSLSFEYAHQVLFPILQEKLGLGPFTMKLYRQGWSMGSTAVGKVQFDIMPLRTGHPLPAFFLEDRGDIVKFHASIYALDADWRQCLRKLTEEEIFRRWPGVEIDFPVEQSSGHKKRVYLLLVAETSNGYRLGRDWLYDEAINEKKPVKTMEKIVSGVVRDMEAEIDHGGCVDEWLQDQLVVFQALAAGRSIVEGRDPSLHTRTARWVAEQMLGVTFDNQGHCEGVAFIAGSSSQVEKEILEAQKDLEQLEV